MSESELHSLEKKKNKKKNIKTTENNILVQKLLSVGNPEDYCEDFDSHIIHSSLISDDPYTQLNNILQAYNEGRKSIMTESVFGSRVDPDKFLIVSKNNVPELVGPSTKQIRRQMFPDPNTKTEKHGYYSQTDLFFGALGSYVINVPQGMIAKAWKGNIPILLGPGPHVIHDPNLKPITSTDLFDFNFNSVTHGSYVLVRVASNEGFKIIINNYPFFLVPRQEPYVFIKNKNSVVWPKDNARFKLSDEMISHYNLTILQVPKGKVAKVWLNATNPKLLEHSDEPYVFSDPLFKIEKHTNDEVFIDASQNLIIHGSIKRIIPKTGEVAVTYNNGHLQIYYPTEDRKPIIINNINHIFDRFISVNIQTVEFPSKKTIKRRTQENKVSDKDIDYLDVNYEVFRTSDGLPIGVKLLVVYEISNPLMTLTKLKPDDIINHIENIVVADMGYVIQNCSSTDFLKSNNPSNRKETQLEAFVADFYDQLQTKVLKALKKDFGEYGIELIRLNIETPKILDETISQKMAEFSLMSTEAGAKIAVMERNFEIAQKQAEQDAVKISIKQQQENSQKVAHAEAELKASEMYAQSILIKARAEAQAQEALLEVNKKRAEQFDKSLRLYQIELANIQSKAFSGVKTTVISPEVAKSWFGMNFTDVGDLSK